MEHIGVYYRISTDKQDFQSQKLAIETWIEALPQDKQPKSIRVFEDEGYSGKTEKRPGLQSLLKTALEGKIDTIIVYKLDRFSRQASTAIRMILNLDAAGVAFISVSQPVLNLGHENPFRRTMIAAFAEIAEIERETIVARVQAGLAAARKKGVVLGRPKKITPECRSDVLQLRGQGLSCRKIASETGLSLGSVSQILRSDQHGSLSSPEEQKNPTDDLSSLAEIVASPEDLSGRATES
ncbi:MAG: recombinase family protein [Deltaproteobacteria bacterium]|nr:recombinase family protein [Deltaproteobacteria bacterium]